MCSSGPLANSIAVVACRGGANNTGSVVPRSSRAVTCRPKQQFPVVDVIYVTSLRPSRALLPILLRCAYNCIYYLSDSIRLKSSHTCESLMCLLQQSRYIHAVCKTLLPHEQHLCYSRACLTRARFKLIGNPVPDIPGISDASPRKRMPSPCNLYRTSSPRPGDSKNG